MRYLCMVRLRVWHIWFLWLWLLTLPVAAIGVPLYAVYCACLKETTLALFQIDDPCTAAHVEVAPASASCCAPKAARCAAPGLPGASSCCSGGDPDHQCTQTTVVMAKLDASFLVEAVALPDLDGFIVEWPPIQLCCLTDVAVLTDKEDALPMPPRPPPLSGREICVRHQLYLC